MSQLQASGAVAATTAHPSATTRTLHAFHTQRNADGIEFLPRSALTQTELRMEREHHLRQRLPQNEKSDTNSNASSGASSSSVATSFTSPTRTFAVANYELDETTRIKHGRIYLYQLQDDVDGNDGPKGLESRHGQGAATSTPAAASTSSTTHSAAGSLSIPRLVEQQVLDTDAVFDLKWCPRLVHGKRLLGQADAAGKVVMYSHSLLDGATASSAQPLTVLHETQVCESASCLYLDWSFNRTFPSMEDDASSLDESSVASSSDPLLTVSRSDGSLSLLQCSNEGLDHLASWIGHDYEVWVSSFDTHSHGNTFYSGADDCAFKSWDTRSCIAMGHSPGRRKAMMEDKTTHTMGVCCISSHPTREHIVATGSYDEKLRIWDTRQFGRGPVLTHELGGGVWRARWRPPPPPAAALVSAGTSSTAFSATDDDGDATLTASGVPSDCMLVGAMHAGFAVVRIDGWDTCTEEHAKASDSDIAAQLSTMSLNDANASSATAAPSSSALPSSGSAQSQHVQTPSLTASTVVTYTKHASLAYGADWCDEAPTLATIPTINEGENSHDSRDVASTTVVTCSFYDKKVDVWSIDWSRSRQ